MEDYSLEGRKLRVDWDVGKQKKGGPGGDGRGGGKSPNFGFAMLEILHFSEQCAVVCMMTKLTMVVVAGTVVEVDTEVAVHPDMAEEVVVVVGMEKVAEGEVVVDTLMTVEDMEVVVESEIAVISGIVAAMPRASILVAIELGMLVHVMAAIERTGNDCGYCLYVPLVSYSLVLTFR
ncbi:hypothetical protein BJ742DRAFT_294701 [Cladochytrium replicatum]|nr:hypothetical protein BJ742DRAFT_294701 [Cladochytrium replicatum]